MRRAPLILPLALTACLTDTVDPGAAARRLTATPAAVRLSVGDTVTLRVAVTDAIGVAVTDAVLTFFSTDATIVTVSPAGVVTGHTPGRARIVVESAGSAAEVPVAVGLAFVRLAAGRMHTCGLAPAGALYCWGANGRGQLGTREHADHLVPARVSGAWSAVAAGHERTCALDRDERAACWGAGTGPTPTRVPGGPYASLTVGDRHACALTPEGRAECWGTNASGQLGDGTTATRALPAPVAGNHRFVALSAGDAHSCGLTAQGQAWCWGANDRGQLAADTITTPPRLTPVPAAGTLRFRSLSAGHGGFTCGVALSGRVWCWGDAAYGRLGVGPAPPLVLRPRVAGDPAGDTLAFVAVNAGWVHTCARTAQGRLACWGTSRLGRPRLYGSAVPVVVDSATAQVAVGATHTCLVTPGRRAACWGGGQDGALGTGERTSSDVPRPVALQLGEPAG